jgi:hypothetical protein
MFRTVSPSIIESLRLYIQHQVYVIQDLWLHASKQSQTPGDGQRNRRKHVEFSNKTPNQMQQLIVIFIV